MLLLLMLYPCPARDREKIYAMNAVEKAPEYPGGMSGLLKYVINNLHVCVEDVEAGFNGKFLAEFTVTVEGKISDIVLIKKAGECTDSSFRALLQHMPDWIPGSRRGQRVAVRYRLPVQVCFRQ